MSSIPRNITVWRQGHVLTDEAAAALRLVSRLGPEKTVVVVISHDCDIACAEEREPNVEVVVGNRIDKLGGDAHAKTARRLHLSFRFEDNTAVPVELEVMGKVCLPKARVFDSEPRSDLKLSSEALVTLQHWLAARYHRAAFPDAFERRLKDKTVKLDRKIARAMDDAAEHVLAVLFDVDKGEEIDRQDPDDVYELRITLLYDSMQDEAKAYAAAQKAADTIEQAFEQALYKNEKWSDIHLLSCHTVSDSAMTVAESRLLKRWRLDHMSLEEEPKQTMLMQY